MSNPRYDLQDRLIAFAVSACGLVVEVPVNPVGCHLRAQLMRSATSVPANYAEGQAAESRRDFVHKMRLCLKELRETMIWLRMLDQLDFVPDAGLSEVIAETDELIAIFVTSIATALRNARKPDR